MTAKIKEHSMVSPYFLFFLIHASQTGIGLLNYQSNLIKGAGHDAWLSILILGISTHLLAFMMVYITNQSSEGDLISFHTDAFGRVLGGALNLTVSLYFVAVGFVVMDTYIDILQTWVFDGIPSWEYALLLSVLIFYIVSGGFRIVSGIAFFGVVIPSILISSLFYLFTYAEFSYLTPVFNHNIKEYIQSAREGGFMFLGFEALLVYLPFVKNGKKNVKYIHYGLLYTTMLYLLITLLTFVFFTQKKLFHITWPTLTMIKVISIPFLERFEFIFIFTWLLVIFPVISIYVWSSIRIVKLTFSKVRATFVLFLIVTSYWLISSVFAGMEFSQKVDTLVTSTGLGFLYLYIPFLFLLSLFRARIKKRRSSQSGNKSKGTGMA